MATTVTPRLVGGVANAAVLASKAAPYTPAMPDPVFVVGNIVLVWVGWLSPEPAHTVSGGGASWTQVAKWGAGSVVMCAIYLGKVDGSDNTAFTVTGAGAVSVQAIELSGHDPDSPVLGTTSRFGTGFTQIHTMNTTDSFVNAKGLFLGSGLCELGGNLNGSDTVTATYYGTAASTAGGKATTNISAPPIGTLDPTASPTIAPRIVFGMTSAASMCGVGILINDKPDPPVYFTADDTGTAVDSGDLYANPVPPPATPALSDSFYRPNNSNPTAPKLSDPTARSTATPILMGSAADDYGIWASANNPAGVAIYGVDRFATLNGRAVVRAIQNELPCMAPFDVATAESVTVEFTWTDQRNVGATCGVAFRGTYVVPDAHAPSWVGLLIPHPATAATQKDPYALECRYLSASHSVNLSTKGGIFTGGSRKAAIGDRLRVTCAHVGVDTVEIILYNLTLGEEHGRTTFAYSTEINGTLVGPCIDRQGSPTVLTDVFEYGDMLAYPTASGPPPRDASVREPTTATDESASLVIIGVQVDVELWEAGVKRATLFSGYVERSSLSTLDLSFDSSLLADPTGTDVEVRLVATGANDTLNIDSVAWDAQYLLYEDREFTQTDSGTGAEGQEALDKQVTETDAGTSTDAVISLSTADDSLALSATDAGAGTEDQLVEVGYSDSDSSTSTEASTLVPALVSSDSAAGADDNLPLGIVYTESDVAYGQENQGVDKAIIEGDTGLGTDSHFVTKPPKVMKHSAERTLVGRASFDLQ